jgi:hypothetical protein
MESIMVRWKLRRMVQEEPVNNPEEMLALIPVDGWQYDSISFPRIVFDDDDDEEDEEDGMDEEDNFDDMEDDFEDDFEEDDFEDEEDDFEDEEDDFDYEEDVDYDDFDE